MTRVLHNRWRQVSTLLGFVIFTLLTSLPSAQAQYVAYLDPQGRPQSGWDAGDIITVLVQVPYTHAGWIDIHYQTGEANGTKRNIYEGGYTPNRLFSFTFRADATPEYVRINTVVRVDRFGGSITGLTLFRNYGVARNLIANPGFESPVVPNPGGYLTFLTGANIGGWIVTGQAVDVHGPRHTAPFSGNQTLDLSGFHLPGGVYQDIPTVPRVAYDVYFMAAGHPFHTDPYPKKRFELRFGEQSTGLLEIDPAPDSFRMNWTPYQFRFVATSDVTRVWFVSHVLNGGAIIDDVAVREASRSGRIILSFQFRRDVATGEVLAQVTVLNDNFSDIQRVRLNMAMLRALNQTGTEVNGSPLPYRLGDLSAGRSTSATLRFPASVGAVGQPALLRLIGDYAGGTFGGSYRVTLP